MNDRRPASPKPYSRNAPFDGVRDDEPALIERVIGGDTEAFRPLVESYERGIFRLVRRVLGGSVTEAEDLCQETFIRAYEYLPRLENRERFGPWLYRIARSLCRDRLRRLESERRALRGRMELARLEAVPGRKDIGSALSALPPEEYEVLKLRYFDRVSYTEIARRKGLSFSRVDHLLRKARARLARRLQLEERRTVKT